MECKIEKYSFVLSEDNTIAVYLKNGVNIETVIKPEKPIENQKDFETECTYWYFEFGTH